ncbi:hypothetical protein ACHAWO_006839 [Cyclotella atomus]|uniref:Uncharacterized protein n=1 Tax=Cyclotella atomus TaxID=382360 RepID=A0ABD3P639_9STRA
MTHTSKSLVASRRVVFRLEYIATLVDIAGGQTLSAGDKLGLPEGEFVRLLLGDEEGDALGPAVGLCEGDGVGLGLGEELGNRLGTKEGLVVGDADGLDVGSVIGLVLGDKLGLADGE